MKCHALAVLLAIGASACADVCARAEALNGEFRVKHRPCFSAGTVREAPLDAEQCRAATKACSPAEAATIDAYLACVEALPACTAATSQAWSEQFLACTAGMGALSPGCFYP